MQQPTTTQNDYGDEVPAWSDVATVWARIDTTSGDESVTAQRAEAALQHTITIRHYVDLDPTWRVVWGARVFEIAAIIPDNLSRETQIMGREVV